MIHRRADVTVGRARVRRATPDSRAHLDSALARVSPAAIGLPAGALLLVRRLKMQARLGPGARADAFVADLHETLRARLAQARASGDGDLLFRDEAELAAAVIASWLTGAAADDRGWRRIVTAGAEPPSWWRRAVLPDSRLLPCVVAALARLGLAEAWASRIDEVELRQATRMLARAHDLVRTPVKQDLRTSSRSRSPPRAARTVAATIRMLVPEAASAKLAAPAREWLTLALVLDRRPGLVATVGFAEALATIASGGSAATHQSASQHTCRSPARRGMLASPHALHRTASSTPKIALPAAAALPPEVQTPTAGTTVRPDMSVETGYGGIFFVLNALLAMDVYGDFTHPGGGTPGIAPFDLLALLGRRWFGRFFADDPADELLATLGGRPIDEPAGRGFTPPPWRVRDAWLAPWPEAQPVDGWHPAGFPLDDDAAARHLPRRPAGRWVASLALYLEARLARALDTTPRKAVRTTCRQHARATLDGDRLTVAFALADHPLALRLAGLDRDPGYISAARRDIAFVFA